MRYVLEGEWSGYVSSQRRIVHREVVTAPKRVARLKDMHGIRYTDGTMLTLDLREARPREKVEPVLGYSSMIRQAEGMPGRVVNVSDMPSDE